MPGGRTPQDAAAAASQILLAGEEQAVFVYLPDCDRAGHAFGWMSPEYLKAAAAVDVAVGRMATWVDEALLMILADHGGGGVRSDDHRYRNALFHLLSAETSCYRYWGAGIWTDYGTELARRASDIARRDE